MIAEHELPRVQKCAHRRWIASYPGKFRFHYDADWRIDPTVCPHVEGILCLDCETELKELPPPSERVAPAHTGRYETILQSIHANDKKCQVCGKTFSTKFTKTKYCSLDCKREHDRRSKREEYRRDNP